LVSINKAIQLKPDNKDYADLKAKISGIKEGKESQKAQQEAKQALDRALVEADKLNQDGDAAGALKKYQEALAVCPETATAQKARILRQIAKSQAKLNQMEAAAQSFQKAVDLADAKDAIEYRKSFAQFYLDQNKGEEALNVLTDSKDADPKILEQTLLTLFQGFKNSQPKIAEIALERVIKVNPQNADAYFELGQMYYSDGKSMDSRTKELFAKYQEIGKDENKLSRIKDMLVLINRRNK
jgi:predicted Zn-dependent protease